MHEESIFEEFIKEGIISVKDNRIKILDMINISSYGSKAWAFTLQEISKVKNSDYLYEIGYLMGEDAAKEVTDVLRKKGKFVTGKLADLKTVIKITGFGIVNLEEDEKNIKLIVDKNHIILYGKQIYGEKSSICDFYRGVYSAFISEFKNKKVELRHELCIGKGQEMCSFVGEKKNV